MASQKIKTTTFAKYTKSLTFIKIILFQEIGETI